MAVTLKQVAEAAGVSRPTANLILLGKGQNYAEATRERVLAAAAELKYKPDIAARGLSTQRSYLIGNLFNYLNADDQSAFTAGVQDVVTAEDCCPIVFTTHDLNDEATLLQACLDRRVDGLIVNAQYDAEADKGGRSNRELIDAAVQAGTPVVEVFGRRYKDIPSVVSDFAKGGELAVNRLAELGAKHIVHWTIAQEQDDEGQYWFAARQDAGYAAAMRDAGLQPKHAMIDTYDYTPTVSRESRWYTQAGQIMADAPDAVITHSRTMANYLSLWLTDHPSQAPERFIIARPPEAARALAHPEHRLLISPAIQASAAAAARLVFDAIADRPIQDAALPPTLAMQEPMASA